MSSSSVTPSNDGISLTRIIGLSDFEDVSPLFNNPNITQWLRDGKPWNTDKINRYLQHFQDEDHLRTGFIDYKIIVGNKTIGIVGFRLDFTPSTRNTFYKGRPFTSVLIDPAYQGKGYATWSLSQSIQNYTSIFPQQTDFYAYIRTDNIRSIRVHTKTGFTELNTLNNHIILGYSSSPQNLSLLLSQMGTEAAKNSKQNLQALLSQWIIQKNLTFPFASTFLPSSSVMMNTYKSSIVKYSNNITSYPVVINDNILLYAADTKTDGRRAMNYLKNVYDKFMSQMEIEEI